MGGDILLDRDNDIMVGSGDVAIVGDDLQQHRFLLLVTAPGEWKCRPLAGVDIMRRLLDDDLVNITRDIAAAFTYDGVTASAVTIDRGQIYVEG